MRTPRRTNGAMSTSENLKGDDEKPSAPHEQEGTLYVGYWVEGLRHGQGTFIDWDDGTTYEVPALWSSLHDFFSIVFFPGYSKCSLGMLPSPVSLFYSCLHIFLP